MPPLRNVDKKKKSLDQHPPPSIWKLEIEKGGLKSDFRLGGSVCGLKLVVHAALS